MSGQNGERASGKQSRKVNKEKPKREAQADAKITNLKISVQNLQGLS